MYASSVDRIRKDQWEELIQYRRQSSGEWVVWGDHNDLLWDDEKSGGKKSEWWTLRAFRDFVAELGAVDLGYTGYPFTWVNRRLLIKKKQEVWGWFN